MISDTDTDENAIELINGTKYKYWIFSCGGCGTNYFRKLLCIRALPNIDKNIFKIIKSIHVFNPPQAINDPNFIGIYIFGDPILSVYSMFERNNVKNSTIHILAGKSLFDPKEEITLSHFLNKYNYDVLRLQEHFNNWYNAKTNYPIIFIKYDDINEKNITELCHLLKKYNINYSKKILQTFKKRSSNYSSINKDIMSQLQTIYGDFKKQIDNLPSFWIHDYFCKS